MSPRSGKLLAARDIAVPAPAPVYILAGMHRACALAATHHVAKTAPTRQRDGRREAGAEAEQEAAHCAVLQAQEAAAAER
jgi:hypothetical protein